MDPQPQWPCREGTQSCPPPPMVWPAGMGARACGRSGEAPTWSHQHSLKLGSWCSRLYSRNSNITLTIVHIHQSRIIRVCGRGQGVSSPWWDPRDSPPLPSPQSSGDTQAGSCPASTPASLIQDAEATLRGVPPRGVCAISYRLVPPRDWGPPWVNLLCSLLATAMPRTHEVGLGPQAQQPAYPALWAPPTAQLENHPELRVGLKPGVLSNKEVPTFKYQPMKCAGTKPSSLSCGGRYRPHAWSPSVS